MRLCNVCLCVVVLLCVLMFSVVPILHRYLLCLVVLCWCVGVCVCVLDLFSYCCVVVCFLCIDLLLRYGVWFSGCVTIVLVL